MQCRQSHLAKSKPDAADGIWFCRTDQIFNLPVLHLSKAVAISLKGH